jgi:acyl-CoA thioesterase-1
MPAIRSGIRLLVLLIMQMRPSPVVPLLACLAIGATLACGSTDSTDRTPPERARPQPSATSLANARPTANLTGPRIVVLGDSLTAGLGLAPEEAYPAVLQDRLREKGLDYHVVNAGISGDTSAAGLSRIDLALEGDVRVLVLALGANDGLRGLPVTQLESNLSKIIERAQSRGVAVVLAGMEAPTNWGDVYTRAFHDVYPNLAKRYNLPLVPFLLQDVAAVPHLNQRDGIHPTAEGDRIIADNVWKVLEPVVTRLPAGKERASGS